MLWRVFPRMHTTPIPHLEHKAHFNAAVLGMIGIENSTKTMMKGVSFPNIDNVRTRHFYVVFSPVADINL